MSRPEKSKQIYVHSSLVLYISPWLDKCFIDEVICETNSMSPNSKYYFSEKTENNLQ